MFRMILSAAAAAVLTVGASMAPAFGGDVEQCSSPNPRERIAACARVIQRNPNDAAAVNNLGWGYNDIGEYDRAIVELDKAIRMNPKLAWAWNNRGVSYYYKRQYDRAIGDYDEAIRLDPKLAFAYNGRGDAYSRKGEWDRSLADLDRALQLNPKLWQSWGIRGYVYNSKGDHDRAIADLNRALELNPKSEASYINRCWALVDKREYDRAIADCDVAIRDLNSKDPNAFNNRGNAYYGKGDFNRAIADYDQTLKLDPNHRYARDSRQRAYAALTPRPDPVRPDPVRPDPVRPDAVRPDPAPDPGPAITVASRRAIVIGINSYPNLGSAAQLERAVADAEAVGDKLASLGFQVTRLTGPNQGTLNGLLRGFETFKKSLSQNDMVVLFYAGHGIGLSDGTYLIPGDVQESSLEVEGIARRAAISENELTNGLRERAGVVISVVDACRNDVFSRAVTRGFSRGLRPVETEGVYKLYSASEGQTALDRLPGGDGSKNSVFTRVFLKALGTPGLNLSTLGITVRDEVHDLARNADHQQTPAVYDKLVGSSRVYFAGGR